MKRRIVKNPIIAIILVVVIITPMVFSAIAWANTPAATEATGTAEAVPVVNPVVEAPVPEVPAVTDPVVPEPVAPVVETPTPPPTEVPAASASDLKATEEIAAQVPTETPQVPTTPVEVIPIQTGNAAVAAYCGVVSLSSPAELTRGPGEAILVQGTFTGSKLYTNMSWFPGWNEVPPPVASFSLGFYAPATPADYTFDLRGEGECPVVTVLIHVVDPNQPPEEPPVGPPEEPPVAPPTETLKPASPATNLTSDTSPILPQQEITASSLPVTGASLIPILYFVGALLLGAFALKRKLQYSKR